ncbi:MAG: pilus assembly protein PilM, partial [Bdellovibrionales bacterium]|nr:pilus assembly protein PilM [Bdellovibrionales bacterium]
MISVGIDIGSFSIKVVEIDASLKPFVINRYKEFALSQDPNRDRKIEIVDILRNLIEEYHSTSAHFVLSLPT